jgi:hypothetical protein
VLQQSSAVPPGSIVALLHPAVGNSIQHCTPHCERCAAQCQLTPLPVLLHGLLVCSADDVAHTAFAQPKQGLDSLVTSLLEASWNVGMQRDAVCSGARAWPVTACTATTTRTARYMQCDSDSYRQHEPYHA